MKHFAKMTIPFLLMLILQPGLAFGQASGAAAPDASEPKSTPFNLKVPEGFRSEPVEEAGIFRWKKDSSEIYVIVGDAMADSPEVLLEGLKKALHANPAVEDVQLKDLSGGRALIYKEKKPEKASSLRGMHMILIKGAQAANLDFFATNSEFDALLPAFDSVMASFELR